MKRAGTITGVILLVLAIACLLPALTGTRSARAGDDYKDELDAIAEEFSAEFVIEQQTPQAAEQEAGEAEEAAESEKPQQKTKTIPLGEPRRMIYYTPQLSEYNKVFAGACYALHINGNPEVVIAIEKSGTGEDVNTYVEVTRLSGAAINVYRNDEMVAEFPETSEVSGAYIGLTK